MDLYCVRCYETQGTLKGVHIPLNFESSLPSVLCSIKRLLTLLTIYSNIYAHLCHLYPIMAATEMNQNGPPLYQAGLGTPPDSPSLPASHPFTLADVQHFIDMVKAIVAMDNVPNGLNRHCHCSKTPFNSPAIQASSPLVTREDLKQRLLEVIQAKSKSPKDVKLDAQEETDTGIIRALKLEFKTVNEV